MDDDEEEVVVPINNDLEKKIADVFTIFDHAGSKSVDAREVGPIVRSLGCCPSEAEVQELVMQMEDAASPGTVHLIKFLPIVAQAINERRYQPATPDQLLEAFQVFDEEGRGYLTKEQLTNLMTQDGEPFTNEELEEMFEVCLDPSTQTVPYEYYINQLMHEPQGESRNVYELADRIAMESLPPPPQGRMTLDMLEEMRRSLA